MTPVPPDKIQHLRYETLDGMRGVAAFCVMTYHLTPAASRFPQNSATAVDIFFILSGFVICHSYGRRLAAGMSSAEYLAKRFVRLYPMYFIGLAIGVPVLYWMQTSGLTNTTGAAIAVAAIWNALYLPSFNNFSVQNLVASLGGHGVIFCIDPPAWSLFFEVVASTAFLFLFRLNRASLVAIVASSYIALLACGFVHALTAHKHVLDLDMGWNNDSFYGGFPRVLYGFTFGLLLYSLATDNRLLRVRDIIRRYFNSSYLIYFLLVLVFSFPTQVRGIYPALVLCVIAPFLVYAGSIITCPDNVSLNIARFLGWISYPLYCLHLPIGRFVFMVAARFHYPARLATICSILLTLVVSVILTYLYDEPVRSYLSRKLPSSLGFWGGSSKTKVPTSQPDPQRS